MKVTDSGRSAAAVNPAPVGDGDGEALGAGVGDGVGVDGAVVECAVGGEAGELLQPHRRTRARTPTTRVARVTTVERAIAGPVSMPAFSAPTAGSHGAVRGAAALPTLTTSARARS